MPRLPPLATDILVALNELSRAQHQVATRSQLASVGLSRHHVAAQLKACRWQELGPLIIVLHNGPLTTQQRWWAAVLSAEGPAGLAARTAAEAAGLRGWETNVVHVLVRRGAKVNAVPGVDIKVHESRRFDAEDIHPTRTPPQVEIERALVDTAVWSSSARTACGALAAGVQQRLTTAGRLREVLESAGRVQHRKLLLAVLTDIEGGAHAVSELDFLRFCRRHGFPKPQLQVRVDSAGRRRYLDATFARGDGRLMSVEIDGAAHLVVATYWQDMRRLNDLVIGGRRILRFPSAAIYADDSDAVLQLRSALRLPDLSDARPPLTGARSDTTGETA